MIFTHRPLNNTPYGLPQIKQTRRFYTRCLISLISFQLGSELDLEGQGHKDKVGDKAKDEDGDKDGEDEDKGDEDKFREESGEEDKDEDREEHGCVQAYKVKYDEEEESFPDEDGGPRSIWAQLDKLCRWHKFETEGPTATSLKTQLWILWAALGLQPNKASISVVSAAGHHVLLALWTRQCQPSPDQRIISDPTIRFVACTQIRPDRSIKLPQNVTGYFVKLTHGMVSWPIDICTVAQVSPETHIPQKTMGWHGA